MTKWKHVSSALVVSSVSPSSCRLPVLSFTFSSSLSRRCFQWASGLHIDFQCWTCVAPSLPRSPFRPHRHKLTEKLIRSSSKYILHLLHLFFSLFLFSLPPSLAPSPTRSPTPVQSLILRIFSHPIRLDPSLPSAFSSSLNFLSTSSERIICQPLQKRRKKERDTQAVLPTLAENQMIIWQIQEWWVHFSVRCPFSAFFFFLNVI